VSSPTPAGGPASAALVATQLSMDGDQAAADKLAATVAAVNSLIARWLNPAADGTWRPEHVLGATMLAARLYRRRNSPEGVATFTAEGAVYVQRNDPDVAMLLGLGSYAPPVVG
jgi:hypothetical protein